MLTVRRSERSLNQTSSSTDPPVCCFIVAQVTRNELDKLKMAYRTLSRDANNAKEKYKDALAKGLNIIYYKIILAVEQTLLSVFVFLFFI